MNRRLKRLLSRYALPFHTWVRPGEDTIKNACVKNPETLWEGQASQTRKYPGRQNRTVS
jgi:hypothetical protein